MKKVFVKKEVKCNKFSEVKFNEEHNRYYFVAQSEPDFDFKTGTFKAGESVVVGNANQKLVEKHLNRMKTYLATPDEETGELPEYVTIEKIEAVYVDEDDSISE